MLRVLTIGMLLGLASPAAGAPCLKASACTEWVALGQSGRSLVYRSFPLETRNDRIRRVLIVVHGSDRQADGNFEVGLAAARLEGALDDTLVIAPRFASRDGLTCSDTLAAGELNWPCDGNSWRSGGAAPGDGSRRSTWPTRYFERFQGRRCFPISARLSCRDILPGDNS